MTTKIWTKPQTQAAIRALRAAGYKEQKLDAGYVVRTPNPEREVFRAMRGIRGYLVRYQDGLFANEPQIKNA